MHSEDACTLFRHLCLWKRPRIFLKRAVIFDYERADYEGPIETEEWMTAVGENYRIGDDGVPQYDPNRYRTIPHLLFCIKLCAKYNGKPFDPKQVPKWSSVGQTRIVRDRLTHPTKMPDLAVTDDELRHAQAAVGWFEDCITRAT
jgi:hypothetical protein